MKKNLIIRISLTILFALFLYYFMLPPINLHSIIFYVYCISIYMFYLIISLPNLFIDFTKKIYTRNYNFRNKGMLYGFIIAFSIIPIILVINFFLSPVFNSKAYYNRIKINENGNFNEDLKEVDFNHIPLLDKESSRKLGDRVMGQMTDLVSQFYVSSLYTQINYNDEIVRVTPLGYSGFIKYLTNHKDGIPAYIMVNSVDGKASLNRLENKIKYDPSAYFFENLYRKLRFQYPTLIFGDENFEIDNEGNPYWIVPVIKYVGVGLRKEVSRVIIFNPVNGESKIYDVKDVPSWVDHVYSADLIIEQVNNWGLYKNGFLNTLFGQKEVVSTTEGYNYTIIDDDVYLYTGVTSVLSDESNIGFILSNLRTKETTFYEIAGAEEFSAMDSAEGQVQQMDYDASFPLLINLNGKPTYLMSLKDDAGLVKMYAFVDVKDYQKVVVTDSKEGIEKAALNYLGDDKVIDEDKLVTKEIIINNLTNVVINGNTYYYFTDENNNKYKANINVNPNLIPFLENKNKINVSFIENSEINEIVKLEK